MKNTALLIGLLLAFGLGLAAWMLSSQEPRPTFESWGGPTATSGLPADVEERIRALEQAVAEERDARQLLEEELQALYAEIGALTDDRETRQAVGEQRPGASQDARSLLEARVARRTSPEARADALIEAGFMPDRAEWVVRREAELQMEAMQARFEARRTGESFDPFDLALNPGRALRAEIGDEEYERYLTANDRPTSVAVNSVLEASPGQAAGLQPGDEILRYDGERVFNSFELTQATMQGEPGESVLVDILRDGTPMQVVMPRGPIGISAGGRFRRR
jgi:hypothetical protein